MSSRYFEGGTVDVRSLRHDLHGLITPLKTGLDCMKAGEQQDGLMLQEEVLKKLMSIVQGLNQAPTGQAQIEKDGEN